MTHRAWYRAAMPILILAVSVFSQTTRSSSSPVTTPAATPVESPGGSPSPAAPGPTPIPIPDLISQAESLNGDLAATDRSLANDQQVTAIENQLPTVTQKIETEYDRMPALLDSHASMDSLNAALDRWSSLGQTLPAWQATLTARASEFERQLAELDGRKDIWVQSLQLAQQSDVPPEIIGRVQSAISAIQTTREKVEARRKEVLSLQERVASQASSVNGALSSIKEKRNEALSRIFVKDSPPLWTREAFSGGSQQLVAETGLAYRTEWQALVKYCREHILNFVIQVLLMAALLWPLYGARRRIRLWLTEEPNLIKTAQTFRLPYVLSLAIVMLMSGSFFPNAPRLLSVAITLVALVATLIILRPIVHRSLLPVLYALLPFSLMNLVGNALHGLPSRLFALLQIVAAILFLIWFISKRTSYSGKSDSEPPPSFLKPFAILALAAYCFSAFANITGYVTLSKLASSTVLISVYAAVLLYGAVIIAQALVVFALRVKPLALSRAVRVHRVYIRHRIMRWVRWLAIILWISILLNRLAISERAATLVTRILTSSISIGTINFSLGDILGFCITLWVAILVSRVISFFLEEEFFPRVKVARGIPYAATKVMQYFVLFIGFILALGALGIDLTHVTILTGALGVGLGFGLQNTLNNFVSGLILLFERPINVDDAVQIGENTGTLRRIGLRASVLRTWQGSEVIVPNGDLISKEVINWTLSDQKRRLDIDVGVAYGTDPRIVMELITKVAVGHPEVLADPAPTTLFVGFGDSALNFQLRAWTTQFDKWMQVRSDLAVGINDTLAEANISIPFPQRSLHLQSIAPEALQAISK